MGLNMAIRLADDLAAVARLFAGWPERLIYAALDGSMGHVWVSETNRAAQAVTGDFAFLAGDPMDADAAALAGHVPFGHLMEHLLIVPRTPNWDAVIETVWGERAARKERYAIRKDTHHFDRECLEAYATQLPAGYRLQDMDGLCYRLALREKWSEDFVKLFLDEADFLARGLGVMVFCGDEPVAGAASYAVYRGGIEIEIDTREDFRRQGLAAACGAALVLRCLARGLYPSWDAHSRISVALAEKLGYVFDRPYTTYVANTPICKVDA